MEEQPIDEISRAETVNGASLLGIAADGKTNLFRISDIKGDGQGTANAATNPGIPVLSQYYWATPGVTYPNFLKPDNTPITVPLTFDGKTVLNAKMTYKGPAEKWELQFDVAVLPLGPQGWTPVYAGVDDGARRVQQLVDFVGGTGTKPTQGIGLYVGPTGLVNTVAAASDYRGPQGNVGPVGGVEIPLWIAQAYTAGAQRNHLSKDWTANVNTLATDIPGTSPKWTERLTYVDKQKFNDLDNLTKPAQTMIFVDNLQGKWGVMGPNGEIYFLIDKDDKIDAFDLSDRLYTALNAKLGNQLTTTIIAAITSSLGLQTISNIRYVWGIFGPSMEVYIAVTIDGLIEGTFAGLEEVKAQMAILTNKVAQGGGSNKSLFVGDSLTANGVRVTAFMALVAANFPSLSFTSVNLGVGGETPASICARVGSVPARFTEEFIIPADLTPVEVSSFSNPRMKTFFDDIIQLLLQGTGNSVNPCMVQGIECTLTATGVVGNVAVAGTAWQLKRNAAGSLPVKVLPNTPWFSYGALNHKKIAFASYWMGQNGGFTATKLVDHIQACIDFHGSFNYTVLGLHSGTPAQRADLELLCSQRFGLRYLNLRVYFLNQAFVEMGLTPTTEDLTYISTGELPPTWWSSTVAPIDKVHLNTLGYTAIARLDFNTHKQLGTFKTT